ncbi:MAG: DUF503 domain-containing protein [Armatimonadota bacterium]
MVVGSLRVELYISDGLTLKDKRRVVKSLLGRVGSRFNVSVAEVDRVDDKRHAVIAAACVSNSETHTSRVLDGVLRFIEGEPRASVVACETEYL